MVASVVVARLQADRLYKEGYTGEFVCKSCGESQKNDLFVVIHKGPKPCCEKQVLNPVVK